MTHFAFKIRHESAPGEVCGVGVERLGIPAEEKTSVKISVKTCQNDATNSPLSAQHCKCYHYYDDYYHYHFEPDN
jgi:hypothetical protein